jgi:hypothetical protein
LHRECFPALKHRTPEEVDRKYKQLFVDNPFRDPRLPALVACDQDGGVVGVHLSLIRWWRLGDEKIPARTGTARAIRPALQGQGIYRRLADTWRENRDPVHGDRSLGFSDRLTPVMVASNRKRTDRVTVLDGYGFTWVIPLRRRGARIREIESVLLRRGAPGAGLGWAARVIEAAMEKMVAGERPDLPETATFRDAPLTAQGLHETMGSAGEGYALRLDEDVSALEWMLDYMRDYPSRGHFHGRVLCAANGTPIAFYAGYLRPTKVYDVVALAARPEDRLAVLAQLSRDAYEQGCATVAGWASAAELVPALRCGAQVRADSPASLTTRDEEIKRLFLSHDVLITGFEGERWI